MPDLDLQDIHDFLISLAHRAGAMITSAKPTTSTSGSKKNSADLVTETDRAVEDLISTTLRSTYPSILFMGEETFSPGDTLTRSPTFIVDPIDGTTNFVHSFPYVSISLGLCVGLVPVVGVVYNPFTRTLFSGIRGRGSWMSSPLLERTRLPLQPGESLALATALVAVEWGSDRDGNDYDVKVETFRRLCAAKGGMAHSLRSLGSAALNLCGVAAGQLDAYWEAGCWAWDVCAGWVILSEAGGRIVDANAGNWEPKVDGRRYFAIRAGEGQKEFIEEFWGHVAGTIEVGL